MGRIIGIAEILFDGGTGIGTTVCNFDDFGAVHLDLFDKFLRNVIRYINRAVNIGCSRICRNGSTGIARRVHGDFRNAVIFELIDHAVRTAVLKRARRLTIFHFQQNLQTVRVKRQDRRLMFPERYARNIFFTRIFIDAEQAAAFALIRMGIQRVFFLTFFTIEVHK